MNVNFRNFAIWLVILFMLMGLFQVFQSSTRSISVSDKSYSQFVTDVDAGSVTSVTITDNVIGIIGAFVVERGDPNVRPVGLPNDEERSVGSPMLIERVVVSCALRVVVGRNTGQVDYIVEAEAFARPNRLTGIDTTQNAAGIDRCIIEGRDQHAAQVDRGGPAHGKAAQRGALAVPQPQRLVRPEV